MSSSLFLSDLKRVGYVIAGCAAGIAYLRFHGFLVFHVAAEGVTVLISVFIIARIAALPALRSNAFFSVIAGSFIAVAVFDSLHTATYEGMNLLPVTGANTATTFWVLARVMEAVGYFGSLVLIGRSLPLWAAASVFAAVGIVGSLAVFNGWLPLMYVAGDGLTLTKIWSEYILIGVMLVCLMLVFRMHAHFGARMQVSFIFAVGFTILSEFVFTLYANTIDSFNTLGHVLKFISFSFILLTVYLHTEPPREGR